MALYLVSPELKAAIEGVLHDYMARHKNNPNPQAIRPAAYEQLGLRRFKLTATLSLGGSAAAVFRYRDPSTGTIADSSETLTVFDAQSQFEGESGTYGYCAAFIDGPTPQWEVIQLGCG